MESIFFDKILNVRDIGGYNSKLGKIKYKKVIRGQVPLDITLDDQEKLKKLNLEVIDIRSEKEKRERKSFFKNYHDINLHKTRWPKSERDIPITYMEVLEDFENIKKIFDIILESNKTIYLCCGLGKDRTGIIIMLLLLLCEVYQEDIIADYILSDVYLRDYYNFFHINNLKYPKYLGRSKREYIEKTLELFFNKYQTIDAYFHKVGLTNKEIDMLKKQMIDYQK